MDTEIEKKKKKIRKCDLKEWASIGDVIRKF